MNKTFSTPSTKDWISEEVQEYFGASPIPTSLELPRVSRKSSHSLSGAVNAAIDRTPISKLQEVLNDATFRALHSDVEDSTRERMAREWATAREVTHRTQARRRELLLGQFSGDRPPPYDDPAVLDLSLSEDQLVNLTAFDIEDGVLLRNGRAFTILLPTVSENSSYWLTKALAKCCRLSAAVRLDPLIRGNAADFPRLAYKMLWWGPHLCFKDLTSITSEKFGRWAAGPLSCGDEFTDWAWVPRGSELHLFVEEVPRKAHSGQIGSRYLHAIFSVSAGTIEHIDGATRIFTDDERTDRLNVHVHRTGKIGTRIKVFRVDGSLGLEIASILGANFFVWNDDVAHFFGTPVPRRFLRGDALGITD